jgi:urea carboxylase
LAVLEGPHSTAEFFEPHSLQEFYAATWEVHFNSARTGIRLIGPAPRWSRSDGGEAGLHPSNIHDNAYAIGTVDFTGDMPILLGPDGPSLGGFVCPVTVVQADLWKLGQLRPGDTLKFRRVDETQAQALLVEQENALTAVNSDKVETDFRIDPPVEGITGLASPILARVEEGLPFAMTVRACGDAYALVEYGPMELDLALRFRAHALMEALRAQTEVPLLELTPGIRSLQIHFDPRRTSLRAITDLAMRCERELPPPDAIKVPSRIVHLPLSWDDPQTRLAIDRYQKNVRPDAPWCPSNLEFIRRINGLESIDDVKRIVFDANYLVMGLGDVYLGAPVATPVDPRHRLVTTKYNPARTWTPENAVGIGGAYLCIYGMEGPGGYQFVGRTLQVWNSRKTGGAFRDGKPWLLRFFDQIRFYPVSAEELLVMREDFPRGRFDIRIEETEFDLASYQRFLETIAPETDAFRHIQQTAFAAERDRWQSEGLAEFVAENNSPPEGEVEAVPSGCISVQAEMAGSVWKLAVESGERVEAGQTLLVAEAMKMEIPIVSPIAGKVHSFRVKSGDALKAGRVVAYVEALG